MLISHIIESYSLGKTNELLTYATTWMSIVLTVLSVVLNVLSGRR